MDLETKFRHFSEVVRSPYSTVNREYKYGYGSSILFSLPSFPLTF